MNVGPKGIQLVEEGRSRARLRGIKKLPGATERLEPSDHREQRRDSDSARDQHRMSRALLQHKIVLGIRDREDVSRADHLMDEMRAAATCGILVDRDDIAVPFTLIIHERVAADHSIRQMEVDMTAGREGHEVAACNSHQFI